MMKHLKTVAVVGGFVAVLAVVGILPADAAVPGDPMAKARSGAVNVLNSAATLVPAIAMQGRNALSIYNAGPNTIYCGWTSGVTTSTGYPIPTLSALSIDITCGSPSNCPTLYCIANSADQTSPANTRYIEVK